MSIDSPSVFKVLEIFRGYLGRNIYIILLLATVASFLEGLGVMMIYPVLSGLSAADGHTTASALIMYFILPVSEFSGESDLVTISLVLMVTFFILKGLFLLITHGMNYYLKSILLRTLKGRIKDKIQRSKYNEFIKNDKGWYQNIFSEQINKVLVAYIHIVQVFTHIISSIVYMCLALIISKYFGLVLLIISLLLYIIFRKLNLHVRKISHLLVTEYNLVNNSFLELLSNFKYLKTFNTQNYVSSRLDTSIKQVSHTEFRHGIYLALTMAIKEPIAVITIAISIFVQLKMFNVPLELILISLLLFYRSLTSILNLQVATQTLFSNLGSVEALAEYLRQPARLDEKGKVAVEQSDKLIELRDFSITMDNTNEPLFTIDELTIAKKEFIVIKGRSGSGKTTLIDTLTGLNVNYHGHKKTYVSSQSLPFLNVGYVCQDPVIFAGTVLQNITMRSVNTAEDEVATNKLLVSFGLMEFVSSLHNKLHTVIGSGGVELSGGQKQRLNIIREFYKNPDILILDEPTSALDAVSSGIVNACLTHIRHKICVIVVSHKDDLDHFADKMYSIEGAKVVALK